MGSWEMGSLDILSIAFKQSITFEPWLVAVVSAKLSPASQEWRETASTTWKNVMCVLCLFPENIVSLKSPIAAWQEFVLPLPALPLWYFRAAWSFSLVPPQGLFSQKGCPREEVIRVDESRLKDEI